MSESGKRKSSAVDTGNGEHADKKPRGIEERPKLNSIHEKHAPIEKKIVSASEWQKAAKELCDEEKQLTRLQDAVTKKRMQLPMTVLPDYEFDHVDGNGKATKVKLSQLFTNGRTELIVWHFMAGGDEKTPCSWCSAWCDGFNGYLPHINARADFVAIGKAPAGDLSALAKKKKWNFPMVSSAKNTFNLDFTVEPTVEDRACCCHKAYNFGQGWPGHTTMSQYSGLSTFHLGEDKKVYRVYSTMGRGHEKFCAFWSLFDCLPQGRDGFGPKHKEEY